MLAIQKAADDSASSLKARVTDLESKQLTKWDVVQTMGILIGVVAGLIAIVSALLGGVVFALKSLGIIH